MPSRNVLAVQILQRAIHPDVRSGGKRLHPGGAHLAGPGWERIHLDHLPDLHITEPADPGKCRGFVDRHHHAQELQPARRGIHGCDSAAQFRNRQNFGCLARCQPGINGATHPHGHAQLQTVRILGDGLGRVRGKAHAIHDHAAQTVHCANARGAR